MKNSSYHNFFVNFSNKTRLGIILALKEKPLNVGEITKRVNNEQSNISHQLKFLTGCHIVSSKTEGKKRVYALNKNTVVPVLKLAEKHVGNNCQDCLNHPKNCIRRPQ